MGLAPLDANEEVLLRQTLGLRCQRARERLGLSQRGLARIMGRSQSWVREVEGGEQYAPPYLIRALATATGQSVGWFYGEEGLAPSAVLEEMRRLADTAARVRTQAM